MDDYLFLTFLISTRRDLPEHSWPVLLCLSTRRWPELPSWGKKALTLGHIGEYHSALSVYSLAFPVATNDANISVVNDHKYLFSLMLRKSSGPAVPWLSSAALDSAALGPCVFLERTQAVVIALI